MKRRWVPFRGFSLLRYFLVPEREFCGAAAQTPVATAPPNVGRVLCWCVGVAARTTPYGAGGVPCFLNTASIADWAHFSPSALDTPIEPITSPSTMIGKAPGCGKSCMKVGARFWPVRTILFIS